MFRNKRQIACVHVCIANQHTKSLQKGGGLSGGRLNTALLYQRLSNRCPTGIA
jgi:hypothetical protein